MIAIRAQLPTGGRWRGLQSPSRRPGRSVRRVDATSRGHERQGDAVSRYGMGMSLAQLPAAWMAPRIEARLGPGASQPLFLIVPLLCVCAAAAAAGWIALGLGLSAGGVAAAVLLTALGSPLGSYASLDLSEPLQSAALALALACALAISQPNVTKRAALRCAFLAGLAAGVAILTKSSLWVAAPFALLPLLRADAPVGAACQDPLCARGARRAGWRLDPLRDLAVRTSVRVLRWRGLHASAGWMDSGDCSPVRIEGWFSTFLRSSSRCWRW